MFTNGIDQDICIFLTFSYDNYGMRVYSIIQNLFINILLIIAIIVLCVKKIVTILNIKKSVAMYGSAAGKANKNAPYGWLMLQAFCCAMSWIPIQVLFVLLLCGIEISPEYIAWSSVILMETSSLVNPILYTLKNIKI